MRWLLLAAHLAMWPVAFAGGMGWLPTCAALLLALPGAVATAYMAAP